MKMYFPFGKNYSSLLKGREFIRADNEVRFTGPKVLGAHHRNRFIDAMGGESTNASHVISTEGRQRSRCNAVLK